MPDEVKAPYVPKHPIDVVVSETNPLVRVYNKTNRSFIHTPFIAPANSFATVPKALADFWSNTRPTEIVEAGVAMKELGGAQARVGILTAQVEDLQKELSTLKAMPRDARTQKALNDFQATIEDLQVRNKELAEANRILQEEVESLTEKLTEPAGRAGADSI